MDDDVNCSENEGNPSPQRTFADFNNDELYASIYGSTNYMNFKDEATAEVYSSDGTADNLWPSSEEPGTEDYAEWVFDENVAEDAMMDLTSEQAMATLKYFKFCGRHGPTSGYPYPVSATTKSDHREFFNMHLNVKLKDSDLEVIRKYFESMQSASTVDRTNLMAKTHGKDLDIISHLLNDKEKDLELAAKIGQSLLLRNKQLLQRIEEVENYLSKTKENEKQLQHDLEMKKELVKLYYDDEGDRTEDSIESKEMQGNEDLMLLERRCRSLEKDNEQLFNEALGLSEMTDEAEQEEESLVFDCIEQLSHTKLQITNLTDEIAQKFEDNMQQQEEISQLIHTVVEMQKQQTMLNIENEELQSQLGEINNSKQTLESQLEEMKRKFQNAIDMLAENQEELKELKSNMSYGSGIRKTENWVNESPNNAVLSPGLQDSLANEIEASVRRDILNSQDASSQSQQRKRRTRRTLDSVRYLNTKAVDSSASGRTSPSNWSSASDDRIDLISNSSVLSDGGESLRPGKPKPSKRLQIVKPMEGSDTLGKWHHLASQNVTGGMTEVSEPATPTKNIEDSTPEQKVPTAAPRPVPRPVASPTKPIPTTDTPVAAPRKMKSLFSDLDKLHEKRTIITRTSNALTSMRRGRQMLTSNQTSTPKSQVIGMIANAMEKASVEKSAGDRIIRSLSISESTPKEAHNADAYKAMPHVVKALSLAEQRRLEMNNEDKLPEPETISAQEKLSNLNLTEKTSVKTLDQQNLTVSQSLRSVAGPLGILNRGGASGLSHHGAYKSVRGQSNSLDNIDIDSGVSSEASNQEDATNSLLKTSRSSGNLQGMAKREEKPKKETTASVDSGLEKSEQKSSPYSFLSWFT